MMGVHQIVDDNYAHIGEAWSITVVADNMGAIQMVAKPAKWDELHKGHYGGLQRDLRATLAYREGVIATRHCRSHQERKLTVAELERQSDDQQKDRRANEAADRACEEAEKMHPRLDYKLLEQDSKAARVASNVIRYAGAALDLFPVNERHKRIPKLRRIKEAPVKVVHQWHKLPVQTAMSWRCQTCWKWAASKASGSEGKGPPRQFQHITAAAQRAGHQAVLLRPKEPGMPSIAICAACSAMATQGAKCWTGLLTTCNRGMQRHNNTKSYLKRAWAGQHPKPSRYGNAILYHAIGDAGAKALGGENHAGDAGAKALEKAHD